MSWDRAGWGAETPQVPASLSGGVVSNAFSLSWPATYDSVCAIEKSTNLMEGFVTVATNVHIVDTTAIWTDEGEDADTVFYRIKAE